MGSRFIEKHKRKSVLAGLLFIFHGRAKYVSMLLVVTILSVPFVLSGETLSRMIELRPVAAFLRSVGLGSVVSTINPKYSNDLLKAALDRASSESGDSSFWQKFFSRINATLPPGGGPSSIALIRGSADEVFGPLQVKDGKYDKAKGPGQVKGVVNEEERARGESGDAVDLQGLLAGGGGYGGADGGSGLYGDSMGQDLAGNYGGGAAAMGSGPYANRTLLRGSAAAGGRAAGMYGKVMSQSSNKIPVPASPQKVNTKQMGRVSGFSWKNVGYKTRNVRMDARLGNKKPMFQLAETFAMTDMAARERDSAYEYQASYSGTTYDGNDANLDVIETETDAPVVPDTAYAGGVMNSVAGIQGEAEDCAKSQGTHGARMSEIGEEMDRKTESMGSAPKCYDGGGRTRWNKKVGEMNALCIEFNENNDALSKACQTDTHKMSCSKYTKYTSSGGMLIKSCPKPSKYLKWVIAFALAIIAIIAAVFISVFVGVLIAFMAMAYLLTSMGGGDAEVDNEQVKDKELSDKEAEGEFVDEDKKEE